MDTDLHIPKTPQRSFFGKMVNFLFGSPVKKAVFFLIFLLLFTLYTSLVRPPSAFPVAHIVGVEKGSTLKDIAQDFKLRGVIRSPLLFRAGVILLGGEKSAHAGEYYLGDREGVFIIAYRVARGEFGLTPIVVRVPEGLNIEETALLLSNKIDTFDMTKFLSFAKQSEGYLFPDTYYFLPNVSEEKVFRIMKETFTIRVKEIENEIELFSRETNRTLEEIVIMASIIELEASDLETRRNVSGVLWNRMDIGMALQVDASFVHLLGKGTSQLSLEDLKIDSPYNTYTHVGLPPGPISNPGLSSLLSAVTPISHDYYYYLADKDRVTHFSKTFAEHTRKKAIYID